MANGILNNASTDPDILAQLNSDEGVDAPEPQPTAVQSPKPPQLDEGKTTLQPLTGASMVTPKGYRRLGTPSFYEEFCGCINWFQK